MDSRNTKLEDYLTKEEISKPRTPKQFVNWFEEKLSVTKQLRHDLLKQNILHEGIAKYLYEELFPLYRLLQNKLEEWNDVKFTPILGYQNFDVDVKSNRNNFLKNIEITQADMNYDEKNRMMYLFQNETSEKLKNLPNEARFPEHLKNKIRHDKSKKLLIYKGAMSEKEKGILLKLSKDIPYQNSVKELFQKSQSSSDGSVSMIGKVSAKGTDKIGKTISVENVARKYSELNSEKKVQIHDAIKKKQKVENTPDDTALLVYFDDYIAFSRDGDKKEMEEFLDSIINLWNNQYTSLFLVGASGKGFWERSIPLRPLRPSR